MKTGRFYEGNDVMATLEKIKKRDFSCQRNNLTIRGCEYRPDGDNLPVVIISHPFMANTLFVRHYGKLLAKMGYAAFCFDFCGGSVALGKSDGKTTDMSVLTEIEDLKAVIGYAKSRSYTNENNISLMGCSQGGFVSALTAAQLNSGISKLVLFYPALCIPDDARKGKMMFAQFDPENIPEVVRCGPMKLGRRYICDVLDMDPYEGIGPYSGDVLIVHGTADSVVDMDYIRKAYEVYRSREKGSVRLEIINGAGHIFSPHYDKTAKEHLKRFMG